LAQVQVIIVTQNNSLQADTLPADSRLSIDVLYRPEQETISTLRNKGAEQAQGDYLAFLDADVELSANWTEQMLAELDSDPKRALVSAVQRCDNQAPPLEKIRTALSNAHIDCAVRFLPGRNLLLHKGTFALAGGFPEHLVTCEDYYFTDKVHALGELYYSSKANYIHLGEDKKYKEMFDKEIWRGQSNLQSIKGRPIPASELPSFLVPVWILLFALLALVFAITFQVQLALSSIALLALPIVLYSVRLHRIAKGEVTLGKVLQFYATYFPARIIGTLTGLFKVIKI
jgi:hypothetical protein